MKDLIITYTSENKVIKKEYDHIFDFTYVRHLLKADETFGIRLTSYHNLYFLVNLMAKVRQAIIDDNLLEFRQDFIEKYGYNASKRNF